MIASHLDVPAIIFLIGRQAQRAGNYKAGTVKLGHVIPRHGTSHYT